MGNLNEGSIVQLNAEAVDGNYGAYFFIMNTFFWPGLGTIVAGTYSEVKPNTCTIVGLL